MFDRGKRPGWFYWPFGDSFGALTSIFFRDLRWQASSQRFSCSHLNYTRCSETEKNKKEQLKTRQQRLKLKDLRILFFSY